MASLVIVGTGIKTISHLTVEAQAYIKQSDLVLYLVNEEVMKAWIQRYAKKAESLEKLYFQYQIRKECYDAITEYMVNSLKDGIKLCVALYGHPTVFAMPALKAARIAADAGHDVLVLPAISAEDCLFADLRIDPGADGCQSFEASDFLRSKRIFDPRSSLILWQPASIGLIHHPGSVEDFDPRVGLRKLADYLLGFYSKEHELIIYQAAQLPHHNPSIRHVQLENLGAVDDISSKDTLYLPPAQQ